MFWNLFKRKKQETQENAASYKTWICYAIDDDGLIIDINVEDFSEKSLDNFAKILAGVSTMSFMVDTISVVKEGFANKPDEYAFIMEQAILHAKKEIEKLALEFEDVNNLNFGDEPVVKPSDVIK